MTRNELGERCLVARRGSLHEFRDLDRHRAHHAIEIPAEPGLIQDAGRFAKVVVRPLRTEPSRSRWHLDFRKLQFRMRTRTRQSAAHRQENA